MKPPFVRGTDESASTPGADLTPLLLEFTDLDPGGDLSQPLDGDMCTVLLCSRSADPGGLDSTHPAGHRELAPRFDDHYLVYTYVASFLPGKATAFLANLRETATKCASGSACRRSTNPKPSAPPPYGDSSGNIIGGGSDNATVDNETITVPGNATTPFEVKELFSPPDGAPAVKCYEDDIAPT